MTDSYLLPEVHIIITQVPGVDGISSPARLAQIEADLATMLARPAINSLDDVPDVTVTSPTTGQVLAVNGLGEWENTSASFGTLSRVRDDVAIVTNASQVWARQGLEVSQHPTVPSIAYLTPKYGTGAWTIAEGRHTHSVFFDRVFPFSASGTLTSGTRTLVSGTVSGLNPDNSYYLRGWLLLHARGDGSGASFVMTRVTIDGVGKDNFEQSRLVAGVMVTEPNMFPQTGSMITGVTSVSVSASATFQSGDPSYLSGGVLVIEIESNR